MARKDPDLRPLSKGDFRKRRSYLADEVFASVPGGGNPANQLVSMSTWEGLTYLPTDVLLRTSDYQGLMLDDSYQQYAAWGSATPLEPESSYFMFEPGMDAGDEFHAAPFIAAHGWYRQGTAALRAALEVMAEAAGFAVQNDRETFAEWRAGNRESNFARSLTKLRKQWKGPELFDYKTGIVGLLYKDLCRYDHAKPGNTNVDIWNSNGPVWVWKGYQDFWFDLCDTIAACYILLKLGWPEMQLPKVARPLFKSPSKRWNDIGEDVLREWFD